MLVIDMYGCYCNVLLLLTDNLIVVVVVVGTGIDQLLSQHVAHLFIRDPISVFSEKIHQDDAVDTDHFEVGLSSLPLLCHPLSPVYASPSLSAFK